MDKKPEWLTRAEDEQRELAGKIKRLAAMLADAARMQDLDMMNRFQLRTPPRSARPAT